MSKETKPSVELRIPILKDMELVATNTADVIAKYMELSEEASGEISMALIEATINAFEHSESQKDIFINFTISDDELTIKVIDKGKGFDSEGIQIPDIDSKLKKQERKRGWGVMLIKELMDSVDYESGNDGTTLTMTKKRKMSKIISTEEHNNFVVVKTEGYFNKDLGELVISLVEENVKENKYHFILDLEQSKIVNSIGASILIEVIEILQEKDGSLSLCHMAPIIEKTFSIMGLTKYCNTF